MANRIARGDLDIYNGVLRGVMEFTPGLNIISGENGTLKTRILQALKGGSAKATDPTRPLNIQAISPKTQFRETRCRRHPSVLPAKQPHMGGRAQREDRESDQRYDL